MKRLKATRRHFNYFLFVLVLLSIILFIIEVSFSLPIRVIHIIEYLHILVFLMFGVDLYLEYRRIGDFKKFIKKYWLEILIMVVFSSLGRIFRVFSAARNIAVAGEEVAKTSRILMFAKANHHVYHLKHAFTKFRL